MSKDSHGREKADELSDISDIVRLDYVKAELKKAQDELMSGQIAPGKEAGFWRKVIELLEKLKNPWEMKDLKVQKVEGKKKVIK